MKTSREEMISSILGYSQLNYYRETYEEEIARWSNLASLAFNLSEIESEEKRVELLFLYFILSSLSQEFVSSLNIFRNEFVQSTKTLQRSYFGQTRGKVDWNQTIKHRLVSGGLHTPVYVCNPTDKDFDLPENIVLKFILNKMKTVIDHILSINPKTNNHNWRNKLELNLIEIKKTLSLPYFRKVSSVKTINPRLLGNLKISKKRHYRKLYYLYLLYHKVFVKKDKLVQHALLAERSLFAAKDDKLYEIYVLFKLISQLENVSLKRNLTILGQGNNLFTFELQNGVLDVRFQTLPKKFYARSNYKQILKKFTTAYLLSDPKPRIPDICLTWKPFNNKRNTHDIIIELKYSTEKDYFRDSIYKVYGYLKDYSSVLISEPKSILIFDSLNSHPVYEDELWVAGTGQFGSVINNLFKKWGIN